MDLNTIYNCDCLELMGIMDNNVIDLTVTSPPYDDIRDYKGFNFEFEKIAKELYRVTKNGGVVVWVVGDQIINNTESLTSFKQAIYFVEVAGFNLHDTMIYQKRGLSFPDKTRYHQCMEYMFVFKKGARVKTFNPIEDVENAYAGESSRGPTTERNKDGSLKLRNNVVTKKIGKRSNIWSYATGMMNTTPDKIAFEHPAMFPEKLANDHIVSWSNEGDLVFDPFMGSGTTLKMAIKNRRNYIGSEISEDYCDLMTRRFKDLIFTKQFQVKFIVK